MDSLRDGIPQNARKLYPLDNEIKGARKPYSEDLYPNGPWMPPSYLKPYPPGIVKIVPTAPFGNNAAEAAMTDGGPCQLCSLEHPTCPVCCKVHHAPNCPFLNGITKGSRFNSLRYAVYCCSCGLNYFDEDKWKCPVCSGTLAVLRGKHCAICKAKTHFAYECPFDKAEAAINKLDREKELSKYY